MTRRQRKVHLAVWTLLAVTLPLGLAGVLGLASSQVREGTPVQLEPPSLAAGDGG